MKKTPSKKLQLSRETLRDLHASHLHEAAGGRSNTCPQMCGSDASTCIPTCLCSGNACL